MQFAKSFYTLYIAGIDGPNESFFLFITEIAFRVHVSYSFLNVALDNKKWVKTFVLAQS